MLEPAGFDCSNDPEDRPAGGGASFPRLLPDYTAIIDGRQLQRLKGYLSEAEAKGTEIVSLYPEAPMHFLTGLAA